MSPVVKVWVFRVLGAIGGVGLVAIAGVKADLSHFGMWFPVVATAQVFLLQIVGNLVRKWGEPQ